jgi:hypothetical protein
VYGSARNVGFREKYDKKEGKPKISPGLERVSSTARASGRNTGETKLPADSPGALDGMGKYTKDV